MKRLIVMVLTALLTLTASAQSKVYLTRQITPEALLKIYKALGVKARGRVAVKMSTGEGSNPNYLKPELVKDLIYEVDGTIVECNTAYGATPTTCATTRRTIGASSTGTDSPGISPSTSWTNTTKYASPCATIPISTTTSWADTSPTTISSLPLTISRAIPWVATGGRLKNLSIGCASRNGKAYIHSAGKMNKLDERKLWTREFIGDQDGFLESMAAAAQAVHNYFERENGVIYISVMNNMSVDCDCVDHPAPVKLNDYGILASADPVALDQACVDIVNNLEVTAESDPTDLLKRIDKQHGTHTIDWAEKIGLGSKKYKIINIDK